VISAIIMATLSSENFFISCRKTSTVSSLMSPGTEGPPSAADLARRPCTEVAEGDALADIAAATAWLALEVRVIAVGKAFVALTFWLALGIAMWTLL
jgi:hypothetical protein